MNDMDLLRHWRDAQVPSSATPPAAVRVRALTGGRAPARRRAGMPRLAWSLGLSAGLAVAVVGGVLWAQGAPRSGTTAAGSPSVQSSAAGALVLRKAALALPQNPVVPRPDQFLYTLSSQVAGGGGVAEQHQVWASIDGSRDGVITIRPATGTSQPRTFPAPACHDGRMSEVCPDGKVVAGKYEPMTCHPVPAFLADLPTEPAAMLTWLSNPKAFADGGKSGSVSAAGGQATGADQLVVAFNNASMLLSNYYLTAPMESAVFNALAQLPGITVHEDAVDPAGRHGIGVGPSASSSAAPAASSSAASAALPSAAPQTKFTQLIFDRDSHAFLGTPMFAVIRQSLVDNAGQLPS